MFIGEDLTALLDDQTLELLLPEQALLQLFSRCAVIQGTDQYTVGDLTACGLFILEKDLETRLSQAVPQTPGIGLQAETPHLDKPGACRDGRRRHRCGGGWLRLRCSGDRFRCTFAGSRFGYGGLLCDRFDHGRYLPW